MNMNQFMSRALARLEKGQGGKKDIGTEGENVPNRGWGEGKL